MLKLVFDLTVDGLTREIAAALERRSSYERLVLVARNTILHAAFGFYGREIMPQGCEWFKSADEIAIFDSSAPLLFVDAEPTLPLGRRKIVLGPDHALMPSVPRAIWFLLERFRAIHFIEAFDAPLTVTLKSILVGKGLLPFLDAVVDVIRQCDTGRISELTVVAPEIHRSPIGDGARCMAPMSESESLREFLDKLCQTHDPHGFLKAYVSYYSYLKSNKNISEASRNLNISRTTLHDHLRLAKEFEICSQVESSFPELVVG